MNEITKDNSSFIGYEYKEATAPRKRSAIYLDGYESFGWACVDDISQVKGGGQLKIKLKRDRKILNKTELVRLEQHFEACIEELENLEKSKSSGAVTASILIGLAGTVFMALATFAVTSDPPQIILCVLFAVPGFVGWGLPYFVYKDLLKRRTAKIVLLMENTYDQIYKVCEKASKLL